MESVLLLFHDEECLFRLAGPARADFQQLVLLEELMMLLLSKGLRMRQLTPQNLEIPLELFLSLIGAGDILVHVVFKFPVLLLVVGVDREVLVADLLLQTLDEVQIVALRLAEHTDCFALLLKDRLQLRLLLFDCS